MRLHLTIVARYIYLANDSEDPELASMFSLDDKTQLAFLNQSKYIIESGVNHLRNYIEAYVHDILSELVYSFFFLFNNIIIIFWLIK